MVRKFFEEHFCLILVLEVRAALHLIVLYRGSQWQSIGASRYHREEDHVGEGQADVYTVMMWIANGRRTEPGG